MHCNSFRSLLGSGGAPVFDSGEGVDNVDGGEVVDDQWQEGKVVLCRKRRKGVGLYSLDGVLRSVIHDDGEDGATGGPRRGRGHGEVQVVRAIVTCVLAQDSVVKHSGSLRAFVATVRVVVVLHGRSRSRASCSWCLAGSWR